jgi:ribosomal-protein-alanine N-acetyltransferase
MRLHFRHGTAEDVPHIMPIMQTAFDPAYGEAWTAPQCIGALALPGASLILAGLDDRIVAFALLRSLLDEAELMLVAVDPAHQRQGIGQALLAKVFALSADQSAERLHVEVREDNPALQLYKMQGFTVIGRRRDYYRRLDNKSADALTLCRIVTSADQLCY